MSSSIPPSHPPPPQPAYQATPGSILHASRPFYSAIAGTASTPNARTLLMTFDIAPRSGRAWRVPAGCIFRLSTPFGPQVGDLNLWNARNPRERFWAARTRQLQSSHVTTFDRLWSCLPYMRPMCTIVADSLGEGKEEGKGKWGEGHGVSRWGGRCHDLLGTRCDPYGEKMLTGGTYNYHCHSNLVRAVLPYGLLESDVHDVLNVFQVTGLNEKGQYFMEASPAQPDDYIEFFAEQDLLCALSTCPGGDLSAWGWKSQGTDMRDTCRLIRVEVWALEEAVQTEVLRGWEEFKPSDYAGAHGHC
ncbi:hypothetical protein C8Q80DRAFT_1174519 [Daedaleopsis nitida]|nr:hypothetical protein C8Q80DRAFT_1174519 [Daedaleopsis nitida]